MSNLELNKGDNFIFAVDVSGSMQTADCPGGLTRIEFLKEKVIQFAVEASRYDTDGIDVLTFGHAVSPFPGVTGERAREIITPLRATEGATNTHAVIKRAYKMHTDGCYPQTVLFVATDGQPSDPDAVKATIIEIAKSLKCPEEFAISILTVGVVSDELRTYLTQLDDELSTCGIPDIVDVKTLEEVDFLSAFSGAVHD
jgi:Mg-chelatase subunit ChlD